MSRFKAVIGGLSLYMACFAAMAAEPIFTPRPSPTALAPMGKNAGAADLPPPRAPAPPAPVNAGTLGLPPVQPPPRIIVAPPVLSVPTAPPPAPVKPDLTPKPVVLKETVVRAAPMDVVRAGSINVDKAPSAPVKPTAPAPVKAAKPSPSASAPSPDRRTPVANFSAWEKNCLLPEDLPPLKTPVKIGAKAQARVDVFIRSRPDCAASILDVLAAGETVQVEGKSAGWWRVRNRQWGSFWVGERLLAPMQQR